MLKQASINEDQGVIEGHASVFGNVDQGLDIVERGSFAKTLKENNGKVPILGNHVWTNQIGWGLEAKEDSKGLFVKGQFDIENNPEARKHFSLIKMGLKIGARPGFSFGYRTIKQEPDADNPRIRRLKELKLLEWSPVTFPMNLEAGASAAKSDLQFLQSELEFLINDLESRGYSHSQIIQALKRAADPQEKDPSDKDTQSLLESIKKLKTTIKG
jgi:HK97 family phage prohead protease